MLSREKVIASDNLDTLYAIRTAARRHNRNTARYLLVPADGEEIIAVIVVGDIFHVHVLNLHILRQLELDLQRRKRHCLVVRNDFLERYPLALVRGLLAKLQ